MPPKRIPKDVKIWNEDLTRAAEYRYSKAAREHKRDENSWRKAKDLLAASTAPIYRQKTGDNAGVILNIPVKISQKIVQILMKIVDGTLPITDHPQYLATGAASAQALSSSSSTSSSSSSTNTPQRRSVLKSSAPTSSGHTGGVPPVSIEMTSFYRNRKYGDSCTALLAAMYASLRPQADWVMSKDHIMRSGRRYTDLRMDINRHTGERGAWEGIKQLEAHDLVKRTKKGMGIKQDFALTLYGRQLCHSLFTKKIHPAHLPGIPLIESPYAHVDAAGNVTAKGATGVDTGPGAAFHASNWQQHERQWLGLNDYESEFNPLRTPASQNVDAFPRHSQYSVDSCSSTQGGGGGGRGWENEEEEEGEGAKASAAGVPRVPDDDLVMLRALRCSKFEKSTGKATAGSSHNANGRGEGRVHGGSFEGAEEEEEEEAQLRRVLELSREETCPMGMTDITDMTGFDRDTTFRVDNEQEEEGEEVQLSRVLELSRRDCESAIATDHSQDLEEEMDTALTLSLIGSYTATAEDEEEQRKFEEARRLSLMDSATRNQPLTSSSVNGFSFKCQVEEEEEEDGDYLKCGRERLDGEKREYEEALRLSLKGCGSSSGSSSSSSGTAAAPLISSSTSSSTRRGLTSGSRRQKRDRPSEDSSGLLHPAPVPSSSSSLDPGCQPSAKKTRTKQITTAPLTVLSPSSLSTSTPQEGHEILLLDLTAEENPVMRMGRSGATRKGAPEHVEVPCWDLTEAEAEVDLAPEDRAVAVTVGERGTGSTSCKTNVSSSSKSSRRSHNKLPCIANFDLTGNIDTVDMTTAEVKTHPIKTCSTESGNNIEMSFHTLTGSNVGVATDDSDNDRDRDRDNGDEEFHLMVDIFERVSQKTYRGFYDRIRFYMRQFLPACSADQNKLTHGDFQCTVRRDDCEYSLDFIVERKTLNDIVSRSNDTKSTASLAAPHVKQATALQHCGLAHPFFLVEGDISKMHTIPRAKVDYVGQQSVDMLGSTQDLMAFMAQLLAREWATFKIGLLQTWHSNATAMLLVCMTYFARQRYESEEHRSPDSSPAHLLHGKYPSMQHFRTNKVTARTIKSLYAELKESGIHVEMSARVARRFGSWQVLCQQAYSLCPTERHAQVLLADLSASSTKPTVIDGVRLQQEDTVKPGMLCQIEVFDDLCMMRESKRVFELVTEKFPDSLRPFRGVSSQSSGEEEHNNDFMLAKTTSVTVSEAFETIFADDTSLPQPPGIKIIRSATGDKASTTDSFPWVYVVTSSCSVPGGFTRDSSARPQRLVVLPGDAMLTALVRARELLGPPHYSLARPGQVLEDDPVVQDEQLLPYCHELVRVAVQLLFVRPALPAGWTIAGAEAVAGAGAEVTGSRYQVILEDFCSPVSTHGASGRLAKAISKIVNDRILSHSSSSSTAGHVSPLPLPEAGSEAAVLKLSKEGVELSVDACKDISTIFLKLLPMLVLHLNTECNHCTVIQTRNRKETKQWLETYCKATHEESLLF